MNLQNEQVQCILDDGGTLFNQHDVVYTFGGYFGTLHVTPAEAVDDNQDSSSTSYGTECDFDQDNFDSPFDDHMVLFQSFCEEIDMEWAKMGHPLISSQSNGSTTVRNEGEAEDNPLLIPHRFEEDDIDETLDEDEEESPDLLDIPIFSRTWEDIENAMVENQDEQGRYPVATFGIAAEPLSRRDLMVSLLDPHVLRSEIYEAWQDHVPHLGTIEVHFVHPQPKTELKIDKAVVLIVEVIDSDTEGDQKPILLIATDQNDNLVELPRACYYTPPTSVKYLRLAFAQSKLCQPQGIRECQYVVAGRVVPIDEPFPFIIGSLCKLVIQGLSEDITQAKTWLPQFEMFAAHFNQQVQDQDDMPVLVLHGVHVKTTIQVPCDIVSRPSALKEQISEALQAQDFIIHYTPNGQVHLADTPNINAYHFMIEDSEASCTMLVVTRITEENGGVRQLGVRVIAREDFDDTNDIHRQVTQLYELPANQNFQIDYANTVHNSQFGWHSPNVILHTLHPGRSVRSDRSRSPRRQAGQTEEPTGSDDGTSLLQVKHVVLRKGISNGQNWSSSCCEFVQRTEYVQQHPYQFEEPMTWVRVDSPIMSFPNAFVDLLLPASSQGNTNQVSIVVELWSVNDMVIECEGVRVVTVPTTSDISSIMTTCQMHSRVCATKRNGVFWSGESIEWDHADLVTLFVDKDAPKWKLLTFIDDDQTSLVDFQHHTVFFDETCVACNRVDMVGTEGKVYQWCGPKVRLAPVTAMKGKKKQNQLIWLATQIKTGNELSILLNVVQPNGVTAWDHCRVEKGQLAELIPYACRHQYICNGNDAKHSDTLPREDGDEISCIVRTCKDVCRPDVAASSENLGEDLAPCPCDRWCAGSDPVIGAGSEQCSEKKSRVTLSLEASLPHIQRSSVTQLPGPKSFKHGLNEFSISQVLSPLPDGIQLKESSAKAIWDDKQCEHPQFLELYIDGSAMSCGSGWAIVAVLTDWCGNCSFTGCAAGQIELNPQSESWVGAIAEDNIAAEISALVAAQVTALISHLPSIIRPDLQFSRHLVHRTQSTSKVGPIVDVVDIMAGWGAQHVCEVRAHKGNPYNELADTLAKWAAISGGSCGSIPFATPHELATSKDAPHIWLQSMPDSFAATMPQAMDGFLNVESSERNVKTEESPDKSPQISIGEIACQIVSFNAQSIREDKKNQKLHRRDAAITSRLDLQWHESEATIIGIQEARTPEGRFRSKHFEIFSSGADENQDCPLFGCELWFHCQKPLVQFQSRKFFSADFKKTVIHKDPRRLVVKCSAEPISIVVASLHAPCLSQKTSLNQIKQWWNETCSLLKKVDDSVQIICVDANAPLGSETSNAVGSAGAETVNPQGHVVQDSLESMKWCVPSTFEECHEGSSATWRHPKGAWLRRDYIFVSNNIREWCQKSFVDSDFDSGKSHIDHLPVVLNIKGFVQGSCPSRFAKIDPSKVADPACQRNFQQALSTLPMPSWDVDIDSHCRIWEKNVLELAQQVFRPGPPQKKRHRPQLSEDALQAIAFKRHVLQLMRNSSPQQYDEYKEVLRAIEKDVKQKVLRDQSQWYEVFLHDLQQSGDIHDSKAVFTKLHRLGGGKRAGKIRPLPMMKDQEGQIAQSFQESQEILFKQFAAIEGGKLVPKMSWSNAISIRL